MTTHLIIVQIAFWVCLLALGYTFVGYALLCRILARAFPRPWRRAAPGQRPSVSVVLVVHNEGDRIRARLENLLACQRATTAAFEVIVVSDGSDDGTNEAVRACGAAEVRLIEQPGRKGKSFCLNRGVEAASGEIVVFADARQRFAAEAVARLVECFADAEVGAASGALEIEAGGEGGVDVYWRMEKALRLDEALRDSSVGCTGAIYAIRRALYEAIPDDTLLDDVVIPMRIALRGRRVVFVPESVAFDPQPLGGGKETRRKTRTLAGNFQMLFRYPEWNLPGRHRLWWRLISHKYLRLAAPIFLAGAFFSSVLLRAQPLYGAAFWAQAACYALALAGLVIPARWPAFVSLPGGFLFLNWMVIRGFVYYWRKRGQGVWQS